MIHGHGDDSYRYGRPITANFSSNAYGAADLSGLTAFLCEQLETIISYPHPEAAPLQRMLATELGVGSECICVTNGSVEAIYLIAQAFKGCCSAIVDPTFSEYADACRMHGHRVVSIRTLDIPATADMVWLCNPNNPTGRVTPRIQLADAIRRHPNTLFVVDHAYETFTREPLFDVGEAVAFPNLIVLHSMTKRYAIPGLRLGYLTAAEPLTERIRAQRMPWSVNALAIAAGQYLIVHNMPFDLDALLAEKERLAAALAAIPGLDVLPSDTHFFLVRLHNGTAAELKEWLVCNHGLLIRDASNFEGLDASFLRIAAQQSSHNTLLIDAFAHWAKTSGKTSSAR